MVFCQSCGMPLGEGVYGTNQDGSLNEDYCCYCFKEGEFTKDETIDEMIASCVPFMLKDNPEMTEDEAISSMQAFLPTLKRWKKK